MKNGFPVGVLIFWTVFLAFAGPKSGQFVIQKKTAFNPNQTNYEFDATIEQVTNAIGRAYDSWHYATSKKYSAKVWRGSADTVSQTVFTRAMQLIGHEMLLWKGDGDSLSKGLLTVPGNEKDAYLYGGEAPLCESRIYFKDGQRLLYFADFHIHLAYIGPRRTMVEIHTYDQKVAVGIDRRFSPVRGTGLVCVGVPSTTVEEYEILLRIGAELGEKAMLRLSAPATNSPAIDITLVR